MSGPKVFVIADKQRTDVTEEVKIVLDRLHSSLDWGSGFLCSDDLEAWGTLAGAMGMDVTQIPTMVTYAREYEERMASLRDEQEKRSEEALAALPGKSRWKHQARSTSGEVLVQLEADAGAAVAYPLDQKVEWWVDKGRGWEQVPG